MSQLKKLSAIAALTVAAVAAPAAATHSAASDSKSTGSHADIVANTKAKGWDNWPI